MMTRFASFPASCARMQYSIAAKLPCIAAMQTRTAAMQPVPAENCRDGRGLGLHCGKDGLQFAKAALHRSDAGLQRSEDVVMRSDAMLQLDGPWGQSALFAASQAKSDTKVGEMPIPSGLSLHQALRMARLPRPDLADVPQHLVQRGNDRMPCFHDDEDRRRYLRALHEMACRYACTVHAYVLMTNHVHLLATPRTAGALSKMMQGLGRLYVSGFNARHRRTGTLWEGRYKSCLVDSERYVLTCYRYIELNPVRACMVSDPAEYPWSGFAANALGVDCAMIRRHMSYEALGTTPAIRRDAYRELVHQAISDDDLAEIRIYVQQQRALGTDQFRAMVERKLGRCAAVRAAHRPRVLGKAL